jgi:hypothetical protein
MTDTQGPRVPRRSGQVIQSSVRAHHASRRARAYRRAVLGLLFLVLVVWGANALLVGRPVRAALAADAGTARLQLRARFQYYLDLTTLVLDLRSVDAAAPENALGGLVAAARSMRAASRSFRRVVLAHGRDAVFVLSGEDFARLGDALAAGRNPIDLARSVPQKLRGAAGASGFGPWTGALPPPLGLQAGDAAAAALRWASGGR